MANARTSIPQSGFGDTQRRDRWWVKPLLTFLGLSAFIVYSTWRAFMNSGYLWEGSGTHLLSPFYSPLLFGGVRPDWFPSWAPWSPAFLILWAPAGFRFTCYYYRGAYYKAFWGDPPNCSVGEPRDTYRGEHSFPLIFQNIHRYFFYVAAIFIGILSYDAWKAMWFTTEGGVKEFGMSVGTLVLCGNAFLLGGYTFGCHSFRHLIGGGINKLSKAPIRSKCYECVGCLNAKHMVWAWCSLFWVGFTDVYVWMCASKVWTDVRLF